MRKKKPNPIAAAMAEMRWKGTTKEYRAEHARNMNRVRWARIRAQKDSEVNSAK